MQNAECTMLNSAGRFRLPAESESDARALGVRLRRALLEELPGVAAVAVRIDGVTHEYQAIPGAREDALWIARNVRRIRVRGSEVDGYVGRLSSTSAEVTAGELRADGAEVVNPNEVIARLAPGARLSMEVVFERGVGFQARNEASEGFIPLDADFSPVCRAAVKPTEDSLEIEIETDGSISPESALAEAMRIAGETRTYEAITAVGLVASGHPCPEAAGRTQPSAIGVSGQGCPETEGPGVSSAWANLESYRRFLDRGIPKVLDMLFPLVGRPLEPEIEAQALGQSFTRGRRIDLLDYRLQAPELTPAQCLAERRTYEARLILRARANRTAEDGVFGSDHPGRLEVQEIDMGAIPLMTDEGILVINGSRRACVMLISPDLRVKRVGELIARELEDLVTRMKPILEDRVNTAGWLTADLVKLLPLTAAVNDLLMHANWCQYLDETNPVAVVTHRMRVVAEVMSGGEFDEGGRLLALNHFGRLGYLETPEGPNIGLVHTLCPHSRIDSEGRILVPYRKVENGTILDETVWLVPEDEPPYRIAEATAAGADGKLREDWVMVREGDDIRRVPASDVQLISVSPAQPLSYSSSLIPFVGHDDPNRALMGSNMIRQAVTLVEPEQPLVKSGYEGAAALDTGRMVLARRAGRVIEVDSAHITVLAGGERDVYDLARFQRSNQATLIDQAPIVSAGQDVVEGQVLADAAGVRCGEIAIGRNVLVAYMPFRGLNFEDAICISDELLREEVFTSVSLEEAEAEVGSAEVWTAPAGARLNPGDVLVQESSGRRRALLAMPGPNPAVVVRSERVNGRARFLYANKRRPSPGDKFANRHGGKGCIARVLPRSMMPHTQDGTPVQMVLNTVGVISRMNVGQILEAHYGLAARALRTQITIPPFVTPPMDELRSKLKEAGLPETGMFTLYDGSTGRAFESPVTVGWLYVTKLAHMVDDKIHATSSRGPSPLIPQPTMRQSANRVGFLEMWALEAYGASATLQESVTIKAHDSEGREKIALALLAGEDVEPGGEGASLRQIENALRGLGISVEEDR